MLKLMKYEMKTYYLGRFGPVRTRREIKKVAREVQRAAIKAIKEDK
jgi:hypothetical protein